MNHVAIFNHWSKEKQALYFKTLPVITTQYQRLTRIESKVHMIGMVLSGEIAVHRILSTGKKILMHCLVPGDLLGLLSMNADAHENMISHNPMFGLLENASTELVATTTTQVLWIPENTLMTWMQDDSKLLKNFLIYLQSRLIFLNFRLACFSHDQALDRLKFVLLYENILPKMNRTQLAEYIGISRSTLYRLLSTLNTSLQTKTL
jgi:CRP-like cAMP-binding protein